MSEIVPFKSSLKIEQMNTVRAIGTAAVVRPLALNQTTKWRNDEKKPVYEVQNASRDLDW
jgi:hypothetical protein